MKKIVINGVMMCSLFITSCVNEDVSIENPRMEKTVKVTPKKRRKMTPKS